MDPGDDSVERILPIDGALLGGVLARLRRDTPAGSLRWTLGDRGVAEVDACFTSSGPVWTTTARLWSGPGPALTPAAIRCVPAGADEVLLTLHPDATPRSVGELARAALDELAEELLWHATRSGLSRRG